MEITPKRVKARAIRLRREPTSTEKAFWDVVRDRRFDGLKFRRQAPLGRFVVDFACFEARLIVEIDGGVHELRADEDAERQAYLEGLGFRVARIRNYTAEFEPERAKAMIRAALLLPSAGEGGA